MAKYKQPLFVRNSVSDHIVHGIASSCQGFRSRLQMLSQLTCEARPRDDGLLFGLGPDT